MIVYHGYIQSVERPDVVHSLRPLDFGQGFYVTTNKEQAIKWARRKAVIYNAKEAVVNVYRMDGIGQDLVVKTFDDNLEEWIDFVCSCRDGSDIYRRYDLVMGKVADDKIFRVVDMYHAGIWDKERALREIRVYPGYDQIAFITQRAVSKLLEFQFVEEV